MKENIENKITKFSNNDKIIMLILSFALIGMILIISEPIFTEKNMQKEFEMLTDKFPIDSETIGNTNSNNGMIALVETKDGSVYRVTYDRWNLIIDGFNKNAEPLIISIEEQNDKNFELIHMKNSINNK
jgi:hypothetical protein